MLEDFQLEVREQRQIAELLEVMLERPWVLVERRKIRNNN
jgi:hypothetical protein